MFPIGCEIDTSADTARSVHNTEEGRGLIGVTPHSWCPLHLNIMRWWLLFTVSNVIPHNFKAHGPYFQLAETVQALQVWNINDDHWVKSVRMRSLLHVSVPQQAGSAKRFNLRLWSCAHCDCQAVARYNISNKQYYGNTFMYFCQVQWVQKFFRPCQLRALYGPYIKTLVDTDFNNSVSTAPSNQDQNDWQAEGHRSN